MTQIKNYIYYLVCALLIALCTLAVYVCLLVRAITATVVALPAQITATREMLQGEVQAVRIDAIEEIDMQARLIQHNAMTAIRQQGGVLDASVTQVAFAVAGLRQDAQPALQAIGPALVQAAGDLHSTAHGVDAIVADADSTVRDLHPQMLGLVAASKVTAGETAQTMRTVRDAAPKIVASVADVGNSADGIAADVQREADEATKPKRWWQKILGPIYTVGRLVAAFL